MEVTPQAGLGFTKGNSDEALLFFIFPSTFNYSVIQSSKRRARLSLFNPHFIRLGVAELCVERKISQTN